MAKLVLSSGGTILNQFFIDKDRLTIGRDAGNDVVVDTEAASGVHAAIITIGNDQVIEDLASAGGTFVNGARVDRHILQHRDVIEFGAFSLCYLNSKASGDIDFDRTMLIAALPRRSGTSAGAAEVRIPGAASAGRADAGWPKGWLKRLSDAEDIVRLDRVVRLLGRAGGPRAVVARRPQGYFLSHVDGPAALRVNGRIIGSGPQALHDCDVVEVGDERLEFHLDPAATGSADGSA
jgi:pSer/pThr/pTyr-binding forkhead associated (FHA) protein